MSPILSNADIRLVILDCDGVLIDSEIISATILVEQISKLGVSIDFHYVQQHFLGRSFPRVVELIQQQFGVDLPAEFEATYRSELLKAFETRLTLMPGVLDALDAMAVDCCVATSSSPPRVRRSLELVSLLQRFKGRVFTASQVANGKPAPDLFLYAAAQMGFAPHHCLVIEDSVPGVEAALAAGMAVACFTGGSHLTGIETPLPRSLSDLPSFDSWHDLFDMAPQLRRPRVTHA